MGGAPAGAWGCVGTCVLALSYGALCPSKTGRKLRFLGSIRRTMASADFCFFTMPNLPHPQARFHTLPDTDAPFLSEREALQCLLIHPICQHHRYRGTSSLQTWAHRRQCHHALRNQYAHMIPARCCSRPLSHHTNRHSIGYAMLTAPTRPACSCGEPCPLRMLCPP